MIKLEKTDVMNMENAIRGARNPMNSWDRMDSCYDENGNYILGENDLKLARKLVKAGSDHRKFLRQIFVSVDITAPLYWYKEYDTYKVSTVANSCSTMHKIHAKPFTMEDFSTDHLENLTTSVGVSWNTKQYFEQWITLLNVCRDEFIKTNDKTWWWQMIQMLPTSYNQLRTCTLSYETLLNQYYARRHHKLDEWHTYCEWIESLPYFKEMCLDGD